MSDSTGPLPPPIRLMQFITGHWVAAAVYSAARLGIPDCLKAGPKTSDQIAQEVGAHGPSVYRLLRALTSLGLFREEGTRTFRLAELGELLRSDHPQSMRPMALFQGAPPHWKGWGAFTHSVKTGNPAFEHVNGEPFFDYCATDPEFSENFNGAMTALSGAAAQAVVEAYDFAGVRKLVDVGGGHGYLLSRILEKNPALTGAVYDLPHVVEGAKPKLAEAGLATRCEAIGGSFFDSVPPGDAYISKNIIHDWDDDHSITILRNMRRAMQGEGRVLLIEILVTPDNRDATAVLIDLEMLHATHGGRERTEEEFAALFRAADLKLSRVVKTNSLFSVLEAKPA